MYAPFGYYSVNDKKFISKIEAMSFASTVPGSGVSYHYHDEVWLAALNFYKYNPFVSLESLYKERALRIREKHDYLILNFSGGADSTTILETFLKNKIKLDEIYVRFPYRMIGKYKPNINDKSPTNMISEWDFSIKPKLDYIREKYPEINIVVHDWIEILENLKVTDDILRLQNHSFGLANFGFNESVAPNTRVMSDRGLRVANIFGNDKPSVLFDPDTDTYKMYFVDIQNSTGYQHGYGQVDISTRIDFYFDTEYPEITLARAHAVANYFKNNPVERYTIDGKLRKSSSRQDAKKLHFLAEKVVNRVCYPNWNMNTFQVDKPDNANKIYHPWFDYIHKANDFDHLKKVLAYNYESISSGIREDLKNVDENGKMIGLKIIPSRLFPLNI